MVYIPRLSGGVKGKLSIISEGLLYVGPERRYLFEWSKITNIFPWERFNILTVIDNSQIIEGRILGDMKYGNSWKKMDYIFQVWEDKIKQIGEDVYFEYPAWCSKKGSELCVDNILWGFLGGLVILVMVLLAMWEEGWWPLELSDDWPIAMGFGFAIYSFLLGAANLVELRRN